MIKYNSNTINDWNFGDDNIIKVYRNNAVCYYKITGGGDTPTAQTPCFAVVNDISQYSDTEFEDVFNNADGLWYKLNNLNQYEEYGIYGSGRTITTYDGKLTIDTESIPQPSRLPSGYTEVEYIESNGTQYINTNAYITNTANFEVGYTISGKSHQWGYVHQNVANGAWAAVEESKAYFGRWNSSYWVDISNQITTGNNTIVYKSNSGITVNETFNAKTLSLTSTDNITTIPLHIFGWWDFYRGGVEMQQITQRYKSFYLKVNGVLIRDLVPCKRDSDNKYGMYDLVSDTFYLSPNGNDFSGGSEVIPPPITATCEFMYSGGSWINVGEVSGGTATLPNVPFTVNYNAKNYDSSTKTLLKTEGQLANVDAVITAGTPTVSDGYLTIASSTRATISGYQTYFNRDNNNPNLTIISKQLTNGNNCHMFANRGSSYNWMYRCYSNKLTLHGASEQGQVAVTTQPVIESVRVNSSRLATYNNYTNGTSSTYSNFSYGSTNSRATALFAGYDTSSGEWFVGDFYWIYMSQNTLTDEQVQQVIDYNEGGGGQPIYPLEYVVREDPPNNLTFSSMTEAESYECPWVGMKATIDGSGYTFSGDSQSGYEWALTPIDYTKEYLTFEPILSAVTFRNSTKQFQYSLDDGATWTTITTANTVTVNVGQKMKLKASFGSGSDDDNGNKFIASGGTWKAYGNVLSLIGSDNFTATTAITSSSLINLFRGCTTLVNVDNLKMPAYTAASKSLRGMFRDCSGLVHVPSDLLNTFTAFTSDATCMGMFEQCTNLLKTPIIPNLSVGTYGLYGMFINCSSLSACTCLITSNIGGYYTKDMLKGTATNGIFYKNPNATWYTSDATMPSGWTIQDYSG